MKYLSKVLFWAALIFSIACQDQNKKQKIQTTESASDMTSQELGRDLAKRFLITDGHIDLPYKLAEEGYMSRGEIPDLSNEIDGNFDYIKAKLGGLNAPFMSIFLPAELQKEKGASKALADSLINLVEQITTTYPKHFALANTPSDVRSNFQKNLISLPMGMENGSGLEDDLNNVKYFFDRGIRYVTLTHGKDNLICDSSYDTTRTWNGLSPYGKQVVLEMNKTGIMVDVSHISDSTFYDVMELTDVPCIASHSSCRKFVPGFERNMTDDMIKRLAAEGGVVQVNFSSIFISGESKTKWNTLSALSKEFSTNNPAASDSAKAAFENEWMEKNDFFVEVGDVADHIDHIVKIAGIDHVGFGSDFDGVGNSLPIGLKTAEDFPNLIIALVDRGYSEEDIEKICSKNVFRVWQAVLDAGQG